MRDLASHPIALYHQLGLRVTINTDNRLITDTTVSRELWLAHTQIGLDLESIKRILISGFKAAFLPFHEKQAMLRQISKELTDVNEDSVFPPAEAASPEANA